MTIKYYTDIIQGSDEWFAARCGLLSASEMKLILTPTLKIASNDKERQHLYELLAQRITKYVEPHYISDAMIRGQEDEIEARILYNDKFTAVNEMGFITNDKWGFVLGFSPDGLVGDDGLIECKSRGQKYQVQTIVAGEMPEEYMLQVQTGLLVSEREWADFISYSSGLPMFVKRVYPDTTIQQAIIEAAKSFHEKLDRLLEIYNENSIGLIPTERRIVQEMVI